MKLIYTFIIQVKKKKKHWYVCIYCEVEIKRDIGKLDDIF